MKGYNRVPTPDDPEVSGCSLCAFKNGAPECINADCWPDAGSEFGYYFKKKKKEKKVFLVDGKEYIRKKSGKVECVGCAFKNKVTLCLSSPRCTPKEGKTGHFIFKLKKVEI